MRNLRGLTETVAFGHVVARCLCAGALCWPESLLFCEFVLRPALKLAAFFAIYVNQFVKFRTVLTAL